MRRRKECNSIKVLLKFLVMTGGGGGGGVEDGNCAASMLGDSRVFFLPIA